MTTERTEGMGGYKSFGLGRPSDQPKPTLEADALVSLSAGQSAAAALVQLDAAAKALVEAVMRKTVQAVREGTLDEKSALLAWYEIAAIEQTLGKLRQTVRLGQAASAKLTEVMNHGNEK